MANYELEQDEVILYEGFVSSSDAKGNLKLTLTSKKMIFEKEKGIFKKELELVDILSLDEVKFYNDEVQIKQKSNCVTIQLVSKNITLTFSGLLDASKFKNKIVDATTNSSIAKRSSNKIKDAFNLVDDTLGLDTRGTIKGVLENGVKGTLWNGIGKKK